MTISEHEFMDTVRDLHRQIDKLRDQVNTRPATPPAQYLDTAMARRLLELERKLNATIDLIARQSTLIERLRGYIDDILMDDAR